MPLTTNAAGVEKVYPLGHPDHERGRLDLQSKIHDRPRLADVADGATQVLDLGCGIGSNVPLLESILPGVDYVGIDFSEDAVERAGELFPGRSFSPMDATDMSFADDSFDFVFANLVFWAIGHANLRKAMAEVARVLRPGGRVYAFEPDGKTLTFYPDKPAIAEVIARWEVAMHTRGPDPFVGRKINAAMQDAGLTEPETFLYPKVSVGTNPEQYKAAAENLSGVYLGPGPGFVHLDESDDLWKQARREFARCEPCDLILESYYVNIGTKPA